MKKMIAVLLSLVVVFNLCGCVNNNSNKTEDAETVSLLSNDAEVVLGKEIKTNADNIQDCNKKKKGHHTNCKKSHDNSSESSNSSSSGNSGTSVVFSNVTTDNNGTSDSDTKLLSELGLSKNTPVVHYDGTAASLVPFEQAMYCCASKIVVRGNNLPNSLDEIGGYKWFWFLDYNLETDHLSSGETCWVYTWNYLTTDMGEINEMKERVDSVANEILSYIPSGASSLQKAQIVHDQLILRLTYDHSCSMPYIRGAYCLATGNAVCAGYARAFAYIMNLAGENVRVIRNSDHAWNEMNGYYFDVTWDDPDNGSSIQNDYFAVSYDYMVQTGHDFTNVY